MRWQRAELRGAALSDPSPGVSAGGMLFSRHVSKELCGQQPCPVLPEAALAGGDTTANGVSGTERHRALAASPGRVEVRQVLVSAKGSQLVPCISAHAGLFAASFTLLQ